MTRPGKRGNVGATKIPARIFMSSAAVLIVCASGLLAGCQSIAVAALGVGASTGVSHSLNGVAYRTFTVPEPRLRVASLAALKRMGMTHDSTEKVEAGELIKARATNRQIEIELESVTASTTRMRATAKNGTLLHDRATATEIILQTEKFL
jgi:hypothetical protein